MSRIAAGRSAGIGVAAALITGATLGNIGSTLMPILLPGMADRYHLSSTGTGTIATLQLIMTALVTLVLTSRAARPGRVRIARIGLIASVAGFALAAAAPDLTALTAGNIVAGAGLGAVNAAGMAAIAATDDTDRASFVAVLGATLVIAALVVALPEAQNTWGGSAEFAVLAVCCIPALWLVRPLPDAPTRDLEPAAVAPVPVMFLIAVAVLGASDQGAWSYSATLGEKYEGMSADTVSMVLAVASFASLAGVLVCGVAVPRFGRIPLIAAFVLVEALAKLVIAAVPWWVSFIVSAVIWQVCFMALLVLVLAVAAAADSSGRWVASATGALAIGTALGPAPSGWILDTLGATAFGAVLAITTVVAAVPLLRTTRAASALAASASEQSPARSSNTEPLPACSHAGSLQTFPAGQTSDRSVCRGRCGVCPVCGSA
ncbi:MFS transporter [Streptomyces sp. NPDC005732]|uniref:MFS transporter n=1 Tax=Streptomyces sp. NPDC005732 TaxID=3157057 RepID=UPI0033C7BA92